jgi:hypothetical protein
LRAVGALVRAQWLTHSSYRLGVVLSFVALAATIVPVYFVADALQPVVGDSIRTEGEHYFGFLIIGLASLYLVGAALTSLPDAVGGASSPERWRRCSAPPLPSLRSSVV